MSKLDKIFNKSKRITINDDTKIVIMSDCHRGSGNNYDNFLKNQKIHEAALLNYYKNGYTYLELGDGDDMWEVKNYKDIIDIHIDTFKLLKKFHDSHKLIMIYGNHDIIKRKRKILAQYFYKYYDEVSKQEEKLLNNLEVNESLVLNYKNYDIFLLHGHQVDFLNSVLWRLSRFLVRHIWRILERIGMKDPTSAAKKYNVSRKIEKKLKRWSTKNGSSESLSV